MNNSKISRIHLRHADCFEFLTSLNKNSVDCIIVDPPYGDKKKELGCLSLKQITKIFLEFKRVLKPRGFLAFFGQQPSYTTWCRRALRFFTYKAEITWYKSRNTHWMGDMPRCYENIMVVCKGRNRLFNKIDGINNLMEFGVDNTSPTDPISHTSVKPLKLMEQLVKLLSEPDDLVLDCFSGSGTTALACKKLDRRFAGCERNPKYHKDSLRRLDRCMINKELGLEFHNNSQCPKSV